MMRKGLIAGLIGISLSFLAQANSLEDHYRVYKHENHQIHVLEIDPDLYKVQIVEAGSNKHIRATVSSIAKRHDALAAVNAGFFAIRETGEGNPVGILKIHDQWVSLSSRVRGALGWDETKEARVLMDRIKVRKRAKRNRVKVEVSPTVDRTQASKKAWNRFHYILGGTPLLIKHGNIVGNYGVEKTARSFIQNRHARTAVCVKKNHHWLWIVASHTKEDDRARTSNIVEGLTIPELAKFLKEQGCQQAVNLDGGGSSTLVLDDEVMNSPAGDLDMLSLFYHERPVSNALIVLPRTHHS